MKPTQLSRQPWAADQVPAAVQCAVKECEMQPEHHQVTLQWTGVVWCVLVKLLHSSACCLLAAAAAAVQRTSLRLSPTTSSMWWSPSACTQHTGISSSKLGKTPGAAQLTNDGWCPTRLRRRHLLRCTYSLTAYHKLLLTQHNLFARPGKAALKHRSHAMLSLTSDETLLVVAASGCCCEVVAPS